MTENIEPKQGAFFPIEDAGNLGLTKVPVDSHGNPLTGRRKQLDEARINSVLAHQSLMEKITPPENVRSLREIGERIEGIKKVLEDLQLADRRYSGMLSEERSRIREEVNRIARANGVDESKI